jgi:CheY-like chemotaxis protein
VLTNLATNARDAMPHGGDLRFELSRVVVAAGEESPVAEMPAPPSSHPQAGEWVCLAVSDTGTGMTEKVRAHVFEPFFTTKEVGKGTGLGLAQVYGIVRQHEGHIRVESEPGRGTTFLIYLPALEERVKEIEAEEPSPPPQGQGETLLLVEDNEYLREAGQSILESLGYRVLTATNGREALAVYEAEGGADLVITDMVMPEMGGKELVRELTRSDPNLKAVGLTGYAVEGVADELREAGFLDVIHKPFDVEKLARVVQRALHEIG